MAGFIKKGIIFLMITLLVLPLFSAAQTLKDDAMRIGYHLPLYTENIDNAYTNHPFINIRTKQTNFGTDLTGKYLTVYRVGDTNGDYAIYPYWPEGKLILTTQDAQQANAGKIFIYPGAGTHGEIILAYPSGGSSARGRVGIGTDSPQRFLDVAGDTRISGTLDVAGPLNVAGKINVTGSGNYLTSQYNFVIRLS